MYDVIIKNGQIAVGSGASAYLGHIGIKGGKTARFWALEGISEGESESQASRADSAVAAEHGRCSKVRSGRILKRG